MGLKYPCVFGRDGASRATGPEAKPLRGERRINRVLVAVRGMLSYAVSVTEAPTAALGQNQVPAASWTSSWTDCAREHPGADHRPALRGVLATGAGPARPGIDAIAQHVAERDPAARRRR